MVFKADWNINIANLIIIATALLTVIGAWYDVKSETKQNSKDIVSIQLQQSQDRQDFRSDQAKQDNATAAVVLDLKQTMKDNKNDITTEIRDLRNDVLRSTKK